MADPRKAALTVSYNGTNISTKLAEYLNSFEYTDVACGESDSISLQINDRDRKWIKSWFPTKGDKLSASLTFKNWDKEGDSAKLSCGTFVIDDFSFSGTPIQMKLDALAAPATSSFKETERTKTYENTTLENIGKTIASRAGISLYYEAPKVSIEAVEQSEEDDCSFYSDLVTTYGYAMKIYKDKIVVFNEATYENKAAVATLTEEDIEPNWSWDTTLCQTYTGAKYEYTNSDKNKTYTVTVGSGSRILKISDAANTLAEAKLITLARINEANKNDTTMEVTLCKANKSIIATSCVKISGLGNIDGKYYVDQVDWSVGTSGTTQKLTLRKVGSRFTKATALATSVATSTETASTKSTTSTSSTKTTSTVDTSTLKKGDKYTLSSTKKGYYTAAEALAGKVTGGHPSGTVKAGTYYIYNISQGMLNLTSQKSTPGSWINPN